MARVTVGENCGEVSFGGVLGLRWSEVVGLRVARLNFFRESLEVAETIAEVRGKHVRAEVKSPASRRTLAVPPFLIAMLSEHLNIEGCPPPTPRRFSSSLRRAGRFVPLTSARTCGRPRSKRRGWMD